MLLRIVIRINIVRCISVNKIEITVLSARVLDALSGRGLKAKTVHEFERYGTRRIVKHCLGKGQILYSKETVQNFVWQERAKQESGTLPHYQWGICRECGMWSKPTQAEETFNSIVEKLRWLQQNSELIHPPAGKANVQSMEIVLLDREIGQVLLDAEPDADALITKILHRAELEYEFCSAGDADPATMQIRKDCAEYKPTDGFPHTFYKEVVSKVILYRDTHIEFKLQNGQIV